MTVAELIVELQFLDQNAEVMIMGDTGQIGSISDVWENPDEEEVIIG